MNFVVNNEWFEIFLDKQTEHKFYTIFLISQMTWFKTTNADSLIKWPTSSCHKRPTFFLLYKFSIGFYILHFLHIHRWFNITDIIPHSPDDGSLEPKRYSVDFVSQKKKKSLLLLGLPCYQFFFAKIYF